VREKTIPGTAASLSGTKAVARTSPEASRKLTVRSVTPSRWPTVKATFDLHGSIGRSTRQPRRKRLAQHRGKLSWHSPPRDQTTSVTHENVDKARKSRQHSNRPERYLPQVETGTRYDPLACSAATSESKNRKNCSTRVTLSALRTRSTTPTSARLRPSFSLLT
jgi:hypothetical protein